MPKSWNNRAVSASPAQPRSPSTPGTPMNFRAYSPPRLASGGGRRSAVRLPIPIRSHIHFLGERQNGLYLASFLHDVQLATAYPSVDRRKRD